MCVMSVMTDRDEGVSSEQGRGSETEQDLDL